MQLAAVDAYFEIAKKYNLNFAQMSLKFCEITKIHDKYNYRCYNNGAVEN